MGCTSSTQSIVSYNNKIPYIITFLGLPGVGKTSIIEYVANEYNPDYPPPHTNGILYRDICLNDINYCLVDTSGYDSHFEEWEASLKESDGAVLVLDELSLTDGIFFGKDFMQRVCPLICQNKLPTIVFVLKIKDDFDFLPLEQLVHEYLSIVPTCIHGFNAPCPEINQAFDFFIDNIVISNPHN